ncbi:hypothetical protein DPX16_5734 [Anabarilius grahami]|uniref:Uncharacterized protein n=1 Tax=Anabarilius grahami TaxID=495550 RepID=A0A3N0ZAE6_ANAGA|nr:hypothetical protein DPX16_5734 [Anabarilius grahami]
MARRTDELRRRFNMWNRPKKSRRGPTSADATATCWYGKAFLLLQAQNRRATWPSAVERRFDVSGQLWTQTLLT